MSPARLLVVGESLVEFVRDEPGDLASTGCFRGPFPSGAPAIAADAAANAGAEVTLVSSVGDDVFGRLVVDRLATDGVLVQAVKVVPGRTTGTAFVAYRADGSRSFVFHVSEAAPGSLGAGDLGEEPERADWIHVSGASLALSVAMADVVLEAVDRVIAAGGRLSVDPNLRPDATGAADALVSIASLIERADVVFTSADEAGALEPALDEARHRGAMICRTMGSEGVVMSFDGQDRTIAAVPVIERDATGAGDTFAGVFLAAVMQGQEPAVAGELANAAGAAHAAALGPMERAGWPA